MSDVQTRVLVVTWAIGIGLIAARVWAGRSERGRTAAREFYSNGAILHPVRNGISTAPLLASGSILFGLSVLLPRSMGVWLTLLVILLLGAAFVASYRVPPPLTPRWMREELEDGRLPAMRPDRLDWLLFWIVLPVVVAAPIAVVVLIVWFGAGQP